MSTRLAPRFSFCIVTKSLYISPFFLFLFLFRRARCRSSFLFLTSGRIIALCFSFSISFSTLCFCLHQSLQLCLFLLFLFLFLFVSVSDGSLPFPRMDRILVSASHPRVCAYPRHFCPEWQQRRPRDARPSIAHVMDAGFPQPAPQLDMVE